MSSQPEQRHLEPLVSVVLPVFNGEHQLAGILAELKKQTYANCEIIIVDDGSTDDSYGAALGLAEGAANVRVIRSPHAGASHARNLGVSESRGEVVFFAEADCVYDSELSAKGRGLPFRDPRCISCMSHWRTIEAQVDGRHRVHRD